MNKKAYNTPKTEVTRIEMQNFMAGSGSVNDKGTKGDLSNHLQGGDAYNDAMSDLNINDGWE